VYKINRPGIYLVILAALFIHLTILGRIMIFGAKPDLMLICVVFFALFLGPAAGFEAGLIAGLSCDLFALDFFWINTLAYAATGLAAGLLSAMVSKESKKTFFLVVFFFTAFSMSLHYMFASILLKSFNLSFREYFSSSILPACLYTAIIAIPIYLKFINIYNFKELQGLL